jgi:hypothetical protein
MTPSALRQQLIALTAFLVDGGVLPASPPLDTSRLITLSYLRRHNAALASPSPPTSDNKSGEEKGMIAGNGGQKKLAQLPTGNGWAEYVEKRYPLLIFSKSYCRELFLSLPCLAQKSFSPLGAYSRSSS